MESVVFSPESSSTDKIVEEAYTWLMQQEETDNFMHNLITACKLEYTTYKNFGILASLFPTYNRSVEKEKRSAEAKAQQIADDAKRLLDNTSREAQNLKKEAMMQTREEIHKLREDVEKENRERRDELQKYEQRLVQKEEHLDRRSTTLEEREDDLSKKTEQLKARQTEVDAVYEQQRARLEEISQMTQSEARTMIMDKVDSDLTHEKAVRIREAEADIKADADQIARKILATAIQRNAADTVSETTVSVVSLPNEEMKGRIIVRGIHPELVKTLGKLRYRTSYGQNVLQHSIDVSYFAGVLAAEVGANVDLAKRAGLLHDIGKAVDREREGTHVELGVELAKRYHEPEAVINTIASHHGDCEPQCVEAVLVAAADAISAARPGARRETLENYIKRLTKLEDIAKSYPGVENCYAIQAGRELRVLVKPEKISEDQATILAHKISQQIESELQYPGQVKVIVIRETRAVDYAK